MHNSVGIDHLSGKNGHEDDSNGAERNTAAPSADRRSGVSARMLAHLRVVTNR